MIHSPGHKPPCWVEDDIRVVLVVTVVRAFGIRGSAGLYIAHVHHDVHSIVPGRGWGQSEECTGLLSLLSRLITSFKKI